VFEALYSMDGDVALVKRICDLAERYGAMAYLDEVHSAGMCGPRGAGIAAREGALHPIDVVVGTLAKVSAVSAAISRRGHIIDAMRSYAPGFIFTAAAGGLRGRHRGGPASQCFAMGARPPSGTRGTGQMRAQCGRPAGRAQNVRRRRRAI
jgi:Aminotransferase class I and II